MNDAQEQIKDFTKQKIKSHVKKTDRRNSRARKEIRASLAKVIKKAITISELLTERDQADNVRVLREAKTATHRIFDPVTKQLIEVPDHKTRLAAITLELAYTEGRPVERQITASGKFEDLQALMERMSNAPSLQSAVEGKEVRPALPKSTSEAGACAEGGQSA
jgi:hypothetical protein